MREDAFYADLYKRHAPGLFAYGYQQTASREDAEDIVLETFLSVLQHQHFPMFDAQKQSAWLWTIARNKVVDHFRQHARRQYASIDWLADALYANDESSPEGEILRHEEYRILYRAIQALPEQQRKVLQLRFGHGLRCAEIAPVLDKSDGAVRMLLSRAIQTLRSIYESVGKEDPNNQRKGGTR